MKYIYADSMDHVDPGYDFHEDRNAPRRNPYWDDAFPHEIMGYAPYDGVLVSRGIVGDHRVPGKYTEAQAMRFRRVGAREFLRLNKPKFAKLSIFGDCGAFTYHKEAVPPYTPEDMAEFYHEGGFTHGCSVDHIIFDYDETVRGMDGGSPEARRRYDITLGNAEAFLALSRRLSGKFTPLGVIQGWSPGSMAEAARRLWKMGYRYLAVGGMVPLRTSQIKVALTAIRDAVPPRAQLHVLGFAKADDIGTFASLRITSFDTTSPLLRAFKDKKSNYYLPGKNGCLQYYTAIRIPQALENNKLMRLVKQGAVRQEKLVDLERRALEDLRAYDREQVTVKRALELGPGLRFARRTRGSGRSPSGRGKHQRPQYPLSQDPERPAMEGVYVPHMQGAFSGGHHLPGKQPEQAARYSQHGCLPHPRCKHRGEWVFR